MSEAPTSRSSGAVFGRYILVEGLGQTTTGELWLAIDLDLDRKVALELLRQTHLDHPHARERMLAAARAMARLHHPNVVVIHDVGEIEGQLFMAMEYIEGQALGDWLAAGPYPWQEVAAIMRQAGAGLAAAHDVGLVHRDVQPANIVIGRDGRIRVLAFGLARPEGLPHPSTVTNEGDDLILDSQDGSGRVLRARPMPDSSRQSPPPPIGEPAYMSPEQHRGETVDACSDQFSLCAIMFEALYGVRPFPGTHRLAVAANVIAGEMVEIPADEQAPAWIHKLVMRGLALRPSDRFEDMHELLAALARTPARTRRRRLRLLVSLVAGAAVIGGVIALTPRKRDPCDDQLALAPSWDPRLGAQVDERTAPGSRAGLRLSEGFELRARRWSEASAQLCRDEQAKRLTPRMLTLRELCLAEHRQALETLAGLASEGTDGALLDALLDALAARPYVALRGLGDAFVCNELGASEREREHLDDAQLRARTRAELILDLDTADAARLAAPELELLRERDSPELTLLRGRLALAAGELEQAESMLHEVAQRTMGQDPELLAHAWLTLVDLSFERARAAEEAARPEVLREVGRLLDYAEAVAGDEVAGMPVELALRRGRLGVALGDPVNSMPPLDAAIELAELDPSRDPDLLAAMLELRSQLHGSPVRVAADKARARAVLQAALGPA